MDRNEYNFLKLLELWYKLTLKNNTNDVSAISGIDRKRKISSAVSYGTSINSPGPFFK